MSVIGTIASLPQMAMNLINSHTKSNAASASTVAKTGVKRMATTTGSGTKTATSTSSQATTGIGTTFLNLLVQELQNQDPTSPMDSTQMVGQMISLNQLDQLIAINSDLTPTTAATKTSSTGSKSSTGSGSGANPGVAGLSGLNGSTGSAANLAAKQALLASPFGVPTSLSAGLSPTAVLNNAAQSVSNSKAIDLSNFNSMFGGNK